MGKIIDIDKETAKINGEIAASLKFRQQKVVSELEQSRQMRNDDEIRYLEWFLQQSLNEGNRTLQIATDTENGAWTTLSTDDGRTAGIGRRNQPAFYTGNIVSLVDKGKVSYDVMAVFADHMPLKVRDTSGNISDIYSAGISVAVTNNKGEILVAPKTSVTTGFRADTAASSFSNVANLENAIKGPEGLAKLGGQTGAIVEILSGKKPESINEVLNGVDIVGNTFSGDENKQHMEVLQAIKTVTPEHERAIADKTSGIWVSPMVIRKTSHLVQAANLAEIAHYDPTFVSRNKLTII